ncbi:hypothetical protein [Halobacillus faecis]|uniref:Uncharacterized protein n=1 Tax=Halobacillus faecis TaxID=360184 RepID=A0A511WNN9_9BACI|nr:hypothetical protein [Halobacillus faecis]GEN52756.1 hypothetical protein HFA01_10180 [Halobacillus faecis]
MPNERVTLIERFFKSWFGWMIGVLVGISLISLWNGEGIDWSLIIGLSIGGLIGTSIGIGLKKNLKKEKN